MGDVVVEAPPRHGSTKRSANYQYRCLKLKTQTNVVVQECFQHVESTHFGAHADYYQIVLVVRNAVFGSTQKY